MPGHKYRTIGRNNTDVKRSILRGISKAYYKDYQLLHDQNLVLESRAKWTLSMMHLELADTLKPVSVSRNQITNLEFSSFPLTIKTIGLIENE